MKGRRSAEAMLAEMVRIDAEARRDGCSVAIDDALDEVLGRRWTRLVREAKALLAERPS